MIIEKITVINQEGLHMRPAGVLARLVKEYPECEVLLRANEKEVKAKAPMQVMSACIKKDCEVEIQCNGTGEEELMAKIVKLFEEGFGE